MSLRFAFAKKLRPAFPEKIGDAFRAVKCGFLRAERAVFSRNRYCKSGKSLIECRI